MSSSAAQSPHTRRGFHLASDLATIARAGVSSLPSPSPDGSASDPFPTYTFQNFYHPLIGSLIQQLNTGSIADMLDPEFLQSLTADFFTTEYQNITGISQPYPANDIDVSIGGPYANYNWELLYHLPVAVAVHLSQNQRFAEAQQWFHLVFDPTSTDMNVPEPGRYWKSFVFRAAYGPGSAGPISDIGSLLELLSTPNLQGPQLQQQQNVLDGYAAITANPFLPHLVARTRPVAYQYYVVMKYLDNLIAWGDSLFARPDDRDRQRGHALLRPGRQPARPAAPGAARPRRRRGHDLRPAQAERRAREPGPDGQRARRAGERSSRSTWTQPRPGRQRAGHSERAAVRHRPQPVLLLAVQSDPPGLLGHGRRPALQDPALREPAGRGPAAAAVRPAARPGHARPGRRGGHRRREHRQRPEPARRPGAQR